MASRKDVIMARYERGIAKEELTEEKRIRDSKGIRMLDNVTAAAEGANMGVSLGQSVGQIGAGLKKAKTNVGRLRDRFKARKDAKKSFIEKFGRKAWKKGSIAEDGTQMASGKLLRQKALENDDVIDEKDAISMYLEGTNDYSIDVNGNVVSSAESEPGVNVEDYKSVTEGWGFMGEAIVDDPDDENDWYLGKWWNKGKEVDADIKKAGGIVGYLKNRKE